MGKYPLLKQFCRDHPQFSYNQMRSLAREGIVCGVVRLGRKLYLDEGAFEKFLTDGGAGLRGGWRRTPRPLETEGEQ